MAKWLEYQKKADFKEMGERLGVDQVVTRILVNRGLQSVEEMQRFLHPSPEQLEDGSKMKDMAKAVSLLKEAIYGGKCIRIIGDYDIDGVQATYILHQGLLHCGAKASYGIPHRITEGYGVNMSMIEDCIADGVEVVITCDNGIAAREAVALAKEAGLTVIITDHHEIPFEMEGEERRYLLPAADAIVNPKQVNCAYPFKGLCGAAVAWKVIQQLYAAMDIPRRDGDVFLENAAFATVGDVMELQGENRAIVSLGLKQLQHTRNLGMQTLIKRCGLEGKMLGAYHIGFVLGPCINASGRLDSATKSLELLEEQNPLRAAALAEQLVSLNEERKVMTEQGVQAAISIVEDNLNNDKVLVIYLPNVHESIAGIVAGRIRERYEKPTFVLVDSAQEEGLKGSGRSVEAFSMYEEMCKCGELFTKFGGHPMAAGLSMTKDNLERFRRSINDNVKLEEEDLQRVVHIDAAMPFSYLTVERIRQLDLLEPFGNGNSKPVFAQKNVELLEMKPIGKQGQFYKGTARGEDGYPVEALYFGTPELLQECLEKSHLLTITYYPQVNTFRGRDKIQIVVTDICV
ncbi:MAG: single-stranded-DNA-specific exonuclease RecJ [Lachnospiraceae bacterium]|nr:single-stranded-DNA-specific exonuclease RecJ [Lachnospiraceae bacterium]